MPKLKKQKNYTRNQEARISQAANVNHSAPLLTSLIQLTQTSAPIPAVSANSYVSNSSWQIDASTKKMLVGMCLMLLVIGNASLIQAENPLLSRDNNVEDEDSILSLEQHMTHDMEVSPNVVNSMPQFASRAKNKYQTKYDRAKKHIQNGNYQKAIKEYEAVLKISPDDPQAIRALAELIFKYDSPHNALTYLNKAVKAFPDDKELIEFQQVASLFFNHDNTIAAVKQLSLSSVLSGNIVLPPSDIYDKYFNTNADLDAIYSKDNLIAQSVKTVREYYYHALKSRGNDFAFYRDKLLEALSLIPDEAYLFDYNGKLYSELGYAYYRLEEYQQAEKATLVCIGLIGKDHWNMHTLAASCFRQGKHVEAFSAYQQSLILGMQQFTSSNGNLDLLQQSLVLNVEMLKSIADGIKLDSKRRKDFSRNTILSFFKLLEWARLQFQSNQLVNVENTLSVAQRYLAVYELTLANIKQFFGEKFVTDNHITEPEAALIKTQAQFGKKQDKPKEKDKAQQIVTKEPMVIPAEVGNNLNKGVQSEQIEKSETSLWKFAGKRANWFFMAVIMAIIYVFVKYLSGLNMFRPKFKAKKSNINSSKTLEAEDSSVQPDIDPKQIIAEKKITPNAKSMGRKTQGSKNKEKAKMSYTKLSKDLEGDKKDRIAASKGKEKNKIALSSRNQVAQETLQEIETDIEKLYVPDIDLPNLVNRYITFKAEIQVLNNTLAYINSDSDNFVNKCDEKRKKVFTQLVEYVNRISIDNLFESYEIKLLQMIALQQQNDKNVLPFKYSQEIESISNYLKEVTSEILRMITGYHRLLESAEKDGILTQEEYEQQKISFNTQGINISPSNALDNFDAIASLPTVNSPIWVAHSASRKAAKAMKNRNILEDPDTQEIKYKQL